MTIVHSTVDDDTQQDENETAWLLPAVSMYAAAAKRRSALVGAYIQ